MITWLAWFAFSLGVVVWQSLRRGQSKANTPAVQFLNFGGRKFEHTLNEDRSVFQRFLSQNPSASAKGSPTVLFVYSDLDSHGELMPDPRDLRALASEFHSSLVVIASENNLSATTKAVNRLAESDAPVERDMLFIVTLQRNGVAFADHFSRLISRLLDEGNSLLEAWNLTQGPLADKAEQDLPAPEYMVCLQFARN